ncbi:LysM peptidoglycan-binding domain-containing protein [Alkalibacterium indicireducens]|uniref:Peptidoglycan hydrolase n=1 Tax=Alkalibacterium indicireducens TaxID=398758 RepID=A0ABN1ADC4_9LACT
MVKSVFSKHAVNKSSRYKKVATRSSSVLASVIVLTGFAGSVSAESIEQDSVELTQLYEHYTALQSAHDSDHTYDDNETSDYLNELQAIKDQLIQLIEDSGGESIFEQVDRDRLSVDQLDTIFNALLGRVDSDVDDAEADEIVDAIEDVEPEEEVVVEAEPEAEPVVVEAEPEAEEVVVEAEPVVVEAEPKAEENVVVEEAANTKDTTETPSVRTFSLTTATQSANPTANATFHVVRSGDTLARIAQTYGTTVSNIAQLNNIQNVNHIVVGQRLTIREGVESVTNALATPVRQTPAEFIDMIAGPAQRVAKEFNLYASVMIAQAALESGFGGSGLSSSPNYNLFGIKGRYQGAYVALPTREYIPAQGGWITVTERFRRYPNIEASLRDYGRLLRNGLSWNSQFYSGTWVENTTSYRDATAWLQGRYATDPMYASKLNNIIALYDLTRFDTHVTHVSEAPATPTPTPVSNQRTHTVVRGDTLSHIARANNTTVANLRRLNNLSSDVIRIGQRLVVSEVQATPAPTPIPTPAPAPAPTPTPVSNQRTHTVVRGDTLSHIAVANNTTVANLRRLNNLSSDVIQIGQRLVVGGAQATPTPTPTPTPVSNQRTHTVVRGDTLSHIAVANNTTVANLRRLNNLSSDVIRIGQRLVVGGAQATPTPAPTPAPAPTPVSNQRTHTVVRGDTLSHIAVANNTTVANLRRLNNLSSDVIRIGQRLVVGGAQATPTPTPAPAPTPVSNQRTHTVVRGDTLSHIAVANNTTVANLRRLNNLSSDVIRIGQRLVVGGAQATPTPTPTPVSNQRTHTVVRGDTLSHIARANNTTVANLRRLNNLSSDVIRIGQRLVVGGAQATPTPVSNQRTHTVVRGDTLSHIAQRYNVTVRQLMTINNLSNDVIFVNQTLRLR